MPIDVEIVDLADYVGQDVATAQAAIEAQGLIVHLAYDYDAAEAVGNVLAQDVVTEGDDHAVVLTISLGPGAFTDARRISGRVRGGRTRRTLSVRYTP